MTAANYGVTMNGKVSTALAGKDGRSVEEELLHRLRLLDGNKRFSLNLWRLPPGVPFDRVDLRVFPTSYIQCAGDFSGRLTCEVRECSADAEAQYVLGHAVPDGAVLAVDQVVSWNGCNSTVRANEVLHADDIAELFLAYYRTGSTPSSYLRRPLDLSV